jgi:hypothetical protein
VIGNAIGDDAATRAGGLDKEVDFFISYHSVDQPWAEWIAWQLEAGGYTTKIQAWDFAPGRDFVHEMERAISTADRVVAVLSAAYLESPHGEAEWRVFYAKDPTGEQSLLLPVRVGEVEPPGLLKTRIYVDLVGQDAATARARLLAAIQRARSKPTKEPEFPGGKREPTSSAGERPPFPGKQPAIAGARAARPSVRPGRAQRHRDSPRPGRRTSVRGGAAVLVVVTVAFVLVQLGAEGRPRWGLLLAGSLLHGLLAILGWAVISRRVVPVVRAVGATVVLVGLITVWMALWPPAPTPVALPGCPEATHLRVLTSPEGLVPTRELADRYERSTARDNQDCPLVSLYVYAASASGKTAKDLVGALAHGWQDDSESRPLRDLGPRPDLWLPDSMLEVGEVEDLAKRSLQPSPIADHLSIASSPIVLGVTAPTVPGKLQDRPGMSWAAVLNLVENLDWRLLRPDPETSSAAGLATAALYVDERTGDLADLTRTRRIEQQIRLSLDELGYRPSADNAALLCQQRQRGTPGVAVIGSEQALVRFSHGHALGGDCGGGQTLMGTTELLLLYPSDTFGLDHPFVRFTWTVDDPRKQAVAAFRAWLLGEGKEALIDVGLRPRGSYEIREPLDDTLGTLPADPAFRPHPPPLGDVAEVLGRSRTSQQPGRVLLAIDTSGSMLARVGAEEETRFEIVARGVQDSLAQMGGQDEVGLSVFPGDGVKAGIRQLVPIKQGDELQRRAVSNALSKATPAGETPLYRAIVDGTRRVGQAAGHRTTALLVLTDGEDTSSGLKPEDVEKAIRDLRVHVMVVAVGEASCEDSPLATIASSRCYVANFDNVDDVLAQLFDQLWRGQ